MNDYGSNKIDGQSVIDGQPISIGCDDDYSSGKPKMILKDASKYVKKKP